MKLIVICCIIILIYPEIIMADTPSMLFLGNTVQGCIINDNTFNILVRPGIITDNPSIQAVLFIKTSELRDPGFYQRQINIALQGQRNLDNVIDLDKMLLSYKGSNEHIIWYSKLTNIPESLRLGSKFSNASTENPFENIFNVENYVNQKLRSRIYSISLDALPAELNQSLLNNTTLCIVITDGLEVFEPVLFK